MPYNLTMSLGRLITFLFGLSLLLQASQPGSMPLSKPSGTPPGAQESLAASPEVTNTTPGQISSEITVSRVVDGDTIELSSGQKVRYIGVDTPEVVDPRKPVQCFGVEASNKNKELVLGKTVRLEKDISETDKYGRLLRYIWVGETLVNDYLVRQGYAHASSYPPDVKYQEQLTQAEAEARISNRGLWSSCSSPNPAVTQPTQTTGKIPPDPDCPIKGNISSSGKIYHLPGQRFYNQTVIDTASGEKWFCSEAEAISAGWRKSKL